MSSTVIEVMIPEGTLDRLDKALAQLVPERFALSRSRLQELIQSGAVFQEGEAVLNPKQKTKGGEQFFIHIPPLKALDLEPENIPLDIVFEDDDLLVINKPSGMVVHPASSVRTGTLVHGLLHHAKDSLSGIGGVERPGIVHRIDKDTSGLLVVAKNDRTHEGLGKQFRAHSIERLYDAFAYGRLTSQSPRVMGLQGVSAEPPRGVRIDLPIARHKTDRLRQAVRHDGKHAITHLTIKGSDPDAQITLLECRLETGRTHQIRVHLNHIGHPLLGDPLYGKGARQLPKTASEELREAIDQLEGQALHARVLGFVHPVTGEHLRFEVIMPPNMHRLAQMIA